MSDDKLLLSPFGAGHLENLDTPTGREFIAGSTSILADPDFFLKNTADKKKAPYVNQLEFVEKYGRCMCTGYGTIWTAQTSGGFVLSTEQRDNYCSRRYNSLDFDRNIWGMIPTAVDIFRKWWNEFNPDRPCVTFMIQNDSQIRRDFFKRGIPLVRGMRGNRAFTIDSVDGVLNSLNYPLQSGEKWYGHCTGIQMLDIADNYLRGYSYKNVDDYYKMRKIGIETYNSWAIFFEDQLSDKGKAWVKMMRAGVTNWERPDDNTLRQEMAAMILRLNPTAINFWNKLNGTKNLTRSEFVSMWERGLGRKCHIQVFTEKTKDAPITRGEVWYILANW